MSAKDFYDIKGLGELPTDDGSAYSASAYGPPKPSSKASGKLRKVLIVVVVLLLLAGAAAGAYWKFGRAKTVIKPTTASSPTAPVAAAILAPSKLYTATDFNLTFNYPP